MYNELSKKDQTSIDGLNIDLSKYVIVDRAKFTKNDLNEAAVTRMERELALNNKKGISRESHIILIPKQTTLILNPVTRVDPGPGQGELLFIEHIQRNYDEEELLNGDILYNVLDNSFSTINGFAPKFVWIPAAIFGLKPSDLLLNYHTDDSLTQDLTEAVHHYHYGKYSSVLGYKKSFVRTTSIDQLNKFEYTTLDSYGEIKDGQAKVNKVVKTRHHGDMN